MSVSIEQSYQVLGLKVGASIEEINQAYRDLVFIWHPDRIPQDNERLQQKAIIKLQEINHAREQLRQIETQQNDYQTSQKTSYQSSYRQAAPKTPYQSSYQQAEPKTTSSHYKQAQRPYYRDFTGADLKGANLQEKDLSGRNFTDADLSNANLSDSFLHRVNLAGANLYQANLFRANLLQANLRGACLQKANLIGADLSGADLSGADLSGAKVSLGDRVMVKLTAAILTGAILPNGKTHP